MINPVISEKDPEELVEEEGCLSVPEYYDHIKRSKSLLAKGITISGEDLEIECEGHLARAFQHEVDHLNGVLFIDHLSPVKKSLFKKKYLKDAK